MAENQAARVIQTAFRRWMERETEQYMLRLANMIRVHNNACPRCNACGEESDDCELYMPGTFECDYCTPDSTCYACRKGMGVYWCYECTSEPYVPPDPTYPELTYEERLAHDPSFEPEFTQLPWL